jgi:hypothetical protein
MNDNSEIIKSKLLPNIIEAIEEYLVSIKSVGALTANRYVYKGGLIKGCMKVVPALSPLPRWGRGLG